MTTPKEAWSTYARDILVEVTDPEFASLKQQLELLQRNKQRYKILSGALNKTLERGKLIQWRNRRTIKVKRKRKVKSSPNCARY